MVVPEVTLVSVVAQSALKAATGSTVQATVPMVRKLLRNVRRDPAIVRKFESWQESRLADGQQRELLKFLGSRDCQGLFELLAFLEYHNSGHWDGERENLRKAFQSEVASRVTLPDESLHRLSGDLWSLVDGIVRLEVEIVRTGGFAQPTNTYVNALLRPGLFPTAAALAAPVEARSGMSGTPQRAVAARGLAQQIKIMTRANYSTMQMPHSRENHRVPVERIYVHRWLSPTRRSRLAPAGGIPASGGRSVDRYVHNNERRFVVLGNPGAGKTTYTRYLMYWIAGLADDTDLRVPLLVELKSYADPGRDFVEVITDRLRPLMQSGVDVATVQDILTLGYGVVVFDGLDEINDIMARRAAAEAIENFCRRYPLTQVVVTSREVGYLTAPVDDDMFETYLLREFETPQVRNYAERWFALVPNADSPRGPVQVESFMRDSEHVMDLRANPLMLSLLCLLYVYDGWIPENRLQVYEECATVLFERWDRVRRVMSRKSGNRQQTWFLFQRLAYWFRFEKGSEAASERRVKTVISAFLAHHAGSDDIDVTSSEAADFLDFCAGRAWLLTKVGTNDRGEKLYDFTHRTFMEYFAACYITRHSQSLDDLVANIWRIVAAGNGDVVAQMAMQQFDLRYADGLDKSIEAMVATADYRSTTLFAFLVNSLHYFRPSPPVVTHLLREALRYVTAHSDQTVAEALARLASAHFDEFRRVYTAFIESTDTDADRRAADHLAGAIGYLVDFRVTHTDAKEFLLFHRDSGELITRRSGLAALGAAYPSALHHLFTHGDISVERYLGAAGSHALIQLPETEIPYEVDQLDSPLIIELENCVRDDRVGRSLIWMLQRIADEPECVLPVRAAVLARVTGVLDRVEHTGGNVALPAHLRTNQLSRAGYFSLVMALLCAAVDLGSAWPGGYTQLEQAAPARAPEPLSHYASSRVLMYSRLSELFERLAIRQQWRIAFRKWGHSRAKIGEL